MLRAATGQHCCPSGAPCLALLVPFRLCRWRRRACRPPRCGRSRCCRCFRRAITSSSERATLLHCMRYSSSLPECMPAAIASVPLKLAVFNCLCHPPAGCCAWSTWRRMASRACTWCLSTSAPTSRSTWTATARAPATRCPLSWSRCEAEGWQVCWMPCTIAPCAAWHGLACCSAALHL